MFISFLLYVSCDLYICCPFYLSLNIASINRCFTTKNCTSSLSYSNISDLNTRHVSIIYFILRQVDNGNTTHLFRRLCKHHCDNFRKRVLSLELCARVVRIFFLAIFRASVSCLVRLVRWTLYSCLCFSKLQGDKTSSGGNVSLVAAYLCLYVYLSHLYLPFPYANTLTVLALSICLM